MFEKTNAFSGFSVNDLEAAQHFYGDILGLNVVDNDMGLTLVVAGSNGIFVYPKADHKPASYTILNFPVDDIDEAVKALKAKGVTFETYPDMTDENNIARGLSRNMGPDIAWFKDPAGNILSVLKQS
jgi:catechol 2,3-dioxygenase-like lactoylglutathione lyase family enzyme